MQHAHLPSTNPLKTGAALQTDTNEIIPDLVIRASHLSGSNGVDCNLDGTDHTVVFKTPPGLVHNTTTPLLHWVIAIYGHRNGHPRSNASDWLTASIRTTEPHYRNRTARSSKITTDTRCVTATLFALQTRARERPYWHLTIV